MRSHYLNALDIESRAERPLSEMERQDFINTINELRETVSSLRMTIKTLQKTIEDLNANESRHKKEIDSLHEMLEYFKNQCEYLQSLNNRHNKNRFSGRSLSQKNRDGNKKKGRDEEKDGYAGKSDDKKEDDNTGDNTAVNTNDTGAVNPNRVKSEGLDLSRGARGSYNTMDAAQEEVLMTTLDGAPSNWKFKEYKNVEEYSKISYVKKTTFKVAINKHPAKYALYSKSVRRAGKRPYPASYPSL